MPTLTFPAQLLLRTHADGSVTAQVLSHPQLRVWHLESEPLLEELQLALSDRIERTHPRLLGDFARSPRARLETLRVADAVVLDRDPASEEPVPTRDLALTLMVERSGNHHALWLPALDARLWLPLDADPTAGAQGFARELLAELDPGRVLALRAEGGDALEALPVEAELPGLTAFTGENEDLDMLPEPAPPPDEDEDATPETRKRKAISTPTLDDTAVPLHRVDKEQGLGRAWEREDELGRLLARLESRRRRPPMVVIGPSGAGKSALLDELARRAVRGETGLPTRKAWFADASRLVANDGFFGSWQRQVLDLLQELVLTGDLWLIGDPLALIDAGKSIHSQQNVAQLLKPVLASGDLRVVAECSQRAWAQLELREPGFARLFTPLRLEDPDPERLRRILDAVARELRPEARLRQDAVDAALELSRRFRGPTALLGASAWLLRRVASSTRSEQLQQHLESHAELPPKKRPKPPAPLPIGRSHVIRHLCEETGLPELLVRDDLPLDPESVRAHFQARILGQDTAVEAMVDLVARIKAGLGDPTRPLGSFLFIGPTGVGKTETVKALAALLFGREDRVLRFDMSEYGGADCVDRLLGGEARSGLVGRVARTPFAVVLLDEIEKAHPAVFDLLLQVLGEGRLSDRQGRLADFRNTVVLMTSNLGVDTWRTPPGFGVDPAASLRAHLLGEVERFFRPELVNRIDQVVSFEPLGAEPIARITRRELDKVHRREGLRGRRIELQVEPEAASWLAERGVDLRFGARPLKRCIERQLVAPLAHHLSEAKQLPSGLVVRPEGDRLAITGLPGRARRAERDELLDRVLEDASTMRWRLHRWDEAAPVRQAGQHVQLVDRLIRTRSFWRDEHAARARLGAAAEDRALVEQVEGLRSRLLALEDLALELWAGLQAERSPDEALSQELAQEASALDQEYAALELEVCMRAAGNRRELARLELRSIQQDQTGPERSRALELLVEVYGALVLARGGELLPKVRSRKVKGLPERVRDEEQLLALGRFLRRQQLEELSLELRGRGMGALFADESGKHELRSGRGAGVVQVWVRGRATQQQAEELAARKRRRIDLRNGTVRDLRLHRQRTGELPVVVAELMRITLLARLFEAPVLGGML